MDFRAINLNTIIPGLLAAWYTSEQVSDQQNQELNSCASASLIAKYHLQPQSALVSVGNSACLCASFDTPLDHPESKGPLVIKTSFGDVHFTRLDLNPTIEQGSDTCSGVTLPAQQVIVHLSDMIPLVEEFRAPPQSEPISDLTRAMAQLSPPSIPSPESTHTFRFPEGMISSSGAVQCFGYKVKEKTFIRCGNRRRPKQDPAHAWCFHHVAQFVKEYQEFQKITNPSREDYPLWWVD